jgi:putative membrane protein
MPDSTDQDPRVYFAAERTLLAWIRTGVALMGFGFAIARFGLFLRQIQATQASQSIIVSHSTWGSPLTGVTLIALGIFVNISASLHHIRTVRQLSSGTWISGKPSRTAVSLATILAVLGVAMAIYILLLR